MKFCASLSAIAVIVILMFSVSCRRADAGARAFTLALESMPETLHPWRGNDASGDRLRQLMFNSLLRKNERFEYIGDLAESIEPSSDFLSYTFRLRSGVRFHNGTELTSADVKYTIETLLASPTEYKKAASFFETIDKKPVSYISGVETLDALTVKINLRKPWNPLLSNLVAISIVPQNSAGQQATKPVGSGAFVFESANESQGIYNFRRFEDYWQGAAQLERVSVRVLRDATTLQAELRTGRLDLAPSYSALSPDSYKALSITPGIKVQQFPGANIVYLLFNADSEIVTNPAVRRAVAHAIDRKTIVDKLLLGQATIAHSILPEESWAYFAGTQYDYDPERAKRILDEAGFPDADGDGGGMRFQKPVVFKLSSAAATRQYAEVIQNYLRRVGIPATMETMELTTLLAAQRSGQFQMTTGRWVGGNQDPVFLYDLFAKGAAFNRGRYVNNEIDGILRQAITVNDRAQAGELYKQAQQIVSDELPMMPLWYSATMVVGRDEVENIKIDASGDWSFVRFLTVKKNT